MCKAGMNVARLNFSHGTHEEQQRKIDIIKKVREELNLPIAIMLDTKGPEYRIKTFKNGKVTLKKGDTFTFTTYGYGHGVGLSQHGANILASQYGYNYAEILQFYYQGTTIS